MEYVPRRMGANLPGTCAVHPTSKSERARAVLDRVRAVPPGGRRCLRRRLAGRPALRGDGAGRVPADPALPCTLHRPRRRDADPGRASGRTARAPRACRWRPAASRGGGRAPGTMVAGCGSSASSDLAAAPARRASRHARDRRPRCPSSAKLRVGLCHLLLQHTSASLTLNENASPDVRRDLRAWLDAAVPEDFAWTHTLEGADDMPAHVKAALTGPRADDAGARRPAGARHLAGDPPLRAPRPRRPAPRLVATPPRRVGTAPWHRDPLADP